MFLVVGDISSTGMDDAILHQLNNVDLGYEEARCVTLDSEDIKDGLLEAKLSVFARLHSGKILNMDGFKVAMDGFATCLVS